MTAVSAPQPEDDATSVPEPPTSAVRFSRWLAGLVRAHDLGALADLRRPGALDLRRGGPITPSHLIAASFAPVEKDRATYEFVAFLFARYHAGRARPSTGYGSVGTALRKIGGGGRFGPEDPGAARLMARISASRNVPRRHLQHAIERARSAETIPPNWAALTEDLTRWSAPGRAVAYRWARDFYTPTRTINGESK
ncbi:type I-E CRISPR-associated protein Cse2/CasB [Nocardia sp. NPDC003482]